MYIASTITRFYYFPQFPKETDFEANHFKFQWLENENNQPTMGYSDWSKVELTRSKAGINIPSDQD